MPSVLRIGSIVLRVDDLERQTEFWEAALDYERSVPLRPGWKSTAAFRLRNPDSSRLAMCKATSGVEARRVNRRIRRTTAPDIP